MCSKSATDFLFLLDSSGSIGYSNWQETVELIGTHWIEEAIVPNDLPSGNRVAARKFSYGTNAFISFVWG